MEGRKNKALVVGGANGIGLAVSTVLAEQGSKVIVVDKEAPTSDALPDGAVFVRFNLLDEDYSVFDRFRDIDTLVITAGFGRLALFEQLSEQEIVSQTTVNAIAPMRIVHRFYPRMLKGDFDCAIMVSIAGFMSSPFFSTYGASKAALKIFIESVNVELEKGGSRNRILNVSPGSLKGTRFNGAGENQLELTMPVARELVQRMRRKEDLWIPQYEEVFRHVLERYHADFRAEGRHSYDYKLHSGRIKS